MIHTVKKYNLKEELIIFLQATSPLRLPLDIDKAITKANNSKNKVLFSASKLEDIIIWEKSNKKLKCINANWENRIPRQSHKKEYLIENGSIYIFSSSSIERRK